MKKIKFLNTELSVAPLCLGTVNYGSAMPEKEAIHQLSRYVELGGNFIDTAHIYGDWEPGMGPLSETAIGKWLKEFPERDRLVISTKGAHPRMQTMQIPRCSDAEIEEDLNSSLELLHTDYVDLYFLHRDDPRRPAGEIVEFLEKQVKAGKIRYYGCSNWKLSRDQPADVEPGGCKFQRTGGPVLCADGPGNLQLSGACRAERYGLYVSGQGVFYPPGGG